MVLMKTDERRISGRKHEGDQGRGPLRHRRTHGLHCQEGEPRRDHGRSPTQGLPHHGQVAGRLGRPSQPHGARVGARGQVQGLGHLPGGERPHQEDAHRGQGRGRGPQHVGGHKDTRGAGGGGLPDPAPGGGLHRDPGGPDPRQEGQPEEVLPEGGARPC